MRIRFLWRAWIALVGCGCCFGSASAQERSWMQSPPTRNARSQQASAATVGPATAAQPGSYSNRWGNPTATSAATRPSPVAQWPAPSNGNVAAPPTAGNAPVVAAQPWYSASLPNMAAAAAYRPGSPSPFGQSPAASASALGSSRVNPASTGRYPLPQAAPAGVPPVPAHVVTAPSNAVPSNAAMPVPGNGNLANPAAYAGGVQPAAAALAPTGPRYTATPASPYAAAYTAQNFGPNAGALPTLAPQPDVVSTPMGVGPNGTIPTPSESYAPGMSAAGPSNAPTYPGMAPSPIAPPMGGFGGGCNTGNCGDPNAYGPAAYDPGVYDPGVPYAAPSCGPWFASASYLMLTRAVSNNVALASFNATPTLSALDSEQTGRNQWGSGLEGRLGRTLGQRWAVEGVWWSTQTIDSTSSLLSPANDISSRLDFQNIAYQGVPLSVEFANSPQQRLYRYNDYQNIEINLIQQALAVDPANRFSFTSFTGARYFTFDETLGYWSAMAGARLEDNDPNTQSNYIVREFNQLIGWQIGGRGTLNVGERLRLFAMPRFGLFANRISQYQHACMVLDMMSHKTGVTLMGQLDAGAAYQILPCCSIFGSYRAMGFSGIAVSDDNFTRTFSSIPTMASINSSSSLIVHGWNAGLQFQF